MTTVLVTGVSRHLGARFARELAAGGRDRVVGLDVTEPRHPLGDAEFVRSDLRNPLLGRILARADVEVVVHLAMTEHRSRRERSAAKEHNVIGTMQLFAAAQAAPRVRRIVLKSTSRVYGSSPKSPSHFSEDVEARGGRHGGDYSRDALEVEGYLRATARRRDDLSTVTLRMAHVVGRDVSSVMCDYLRSPLAPVPVGFDARVQVIDDADAVAALLAATDGDIDGIVNVAAPGVVGLRHAIRLAGGTPVPVVTSTGRVLGAIARRTRLADLTGEDIDYLLWGRVLDTTRMARDLGFVPRRTTREALAALGRDPVASAVATAADDLTARLDPALRADGRPT